MKGDDEQAKYPNNIQMWFYIFQPIFIFILLNVSIFIDQSFVYQAKLTLLDTLWDTVSCHASQSPKEKGYCQLSLQSPKENKKQKEKRKGKNPHACSFTAHFTVGFVASLPNKTTLKKPNTSLKLTRQIRDIVMYNFVHQRETYSSLSS